jgi:polysaccharide deacetylase family protein (PEP-CTERM system associated)
MINAMTVDVEDYFHVSALAKAVPREKWSSMEFRAIESTRLLLEMFDEAEVKATFFVLGWVADRAPDLIREISRQGHEVACHGWSHQLVYNQERTVFREEAARCKALLEDLTGKSVIGYRAASYSITRESLWALDDLIDLGFQYDSSIFPIRHDRYGIPGAGRMPGKMKAPSGRDIVEFPLSTAEILGQRIPCSGGGYFRLLPFGLTRRLLTRVNERDDMPFIFYLHPWEVDPRQPRVDAGWLSTFRHYTNLSVCAERLNHLLKLYKFGTAREVLNNLGLGAGFASMDGAKSPG